MSKRIHELAKEWSQNPKDLLAWPSASGMRGKRSQSSLTDDEVARLREGLGLAPAAARSRSGPSGSSPSGWSRSATRTPISW